MAPRRESGQVSRYIEHFNVTAFGFQSGDWTAVSPFSDAGPADVPGNDVAALRSQIGRASDVAGADVTGVSADFDVVVVRHGNFELHPDLSVRGADNPRRKRAADFYPSGR